MDSFHIFNKNVLGKLYLTVFYSSNIEADNIPGEGCQGYMQDCKMTSHL